MTAMEEMVKCEKKKEFRNFDWNHYKRTKFRSKYVYLWMKKITNIVEYCLFVTQDSKSKMASNHGDSKPTDMTFSIVLWTCQNTLSLTLVYIFITN